MTLDDSLPSLGQMTILTHDDSAGANGGGTFESFFDVFIEIDLIGTTTGFILTLFGNDFVGAPSTPNQWIHTPSDDFFPVGDVIHTGPHPVVNSIPLPAALPLFLTGLAGLALIRRRRKA